MEQEGAGFVSHLEALRGCIIKSLLAVAVLFPLGFNFSGDAISLLVRYTCPAELGALHFFSPLEVFVTEMKLGLLLAFFAAYPYIALIWWRFLLPALFPAERRVLALQIVLSSLLFLTGAVFCVAAILPPVMRFAASFGTAEVKPILGLGSFLNMVMTMMLAFGLMFQAPLAAYLAVRFGLVSSATLRRGRPYVIVALLVLAALLTPPDIISQLALFIPTWLLFELGLLFAATVKKPEKPEENTSGDGMAEFYEKEERR